MNSRILRRARGASKKLIEVSQTDEGLCFFIDYFARDNRKDPAIGYDDDDDNYIQVTVVKDKIPEYLYMLLMILQLGWEYAKPEQQDSPLSEKRLFELDAQLLAYQVDIAWQAIFKLAELEGRPFTEDAKTRKGQLGPAAKRMRDSYDDDI